MPCCQHPNGAYMKILLVEDSYIERHKVGGYLTDWGLEFVAVSSGTDAVKLLEGPNPPDLALLDWILPGMDGIDVLRRIRKLSQSSYVYTVMMTAKNQKKDRQTAMDARVPAIAHFACGTGTLWIGNMVSLRH